MTRLKGKDGNEEYSIRLDKARTCGVHHIPIEFDNATVIVFAYDGPNIYSSDQSTIGLVHLPNGLVGVFRESEDYTGHG